MSKETFFTPLIFFTWALMGFEQSAQSTPVMEYTCVRAAKAGAAVPRRPTAARKADARRVIRARRFMVTGTSSSPGRFRPAAPCCHELPLDAPQLFQSKLCVFAELLVGHAGLHVRATGALV